MEDGWTNRSEQSWNHGTRLVKQSVISRAENEGRETVTFDCLVFRLPLSCFVSTMIRSSFK